MSELAKRFLDLHRPGDPLLIPNPWDAGSAKLLASLGFDALATTSSGFAATLGRVDNTVTREEALTHSAAIVAATPLPVSADLENGFADDAGEPDPDMPAMTMRVTLEGGSPTVMTIVTTFPSAEAMEQLISMGMEEGMTAAVGQIDDLLDG
jgi:hypothetical protein